MTWWRRLLGLPEKEDSIRSSMYLGVRMTKEEYDRYCSMGWPKVFSVSDYTCDLDINQERIIITRRPMSHAVREAEGAQPMEEMKEHRSNEDENLFPEELCNNQVQRVYEGVTITETCTRKSGHTGYHSSTYYYWGTGCHAQSIRDFNGNPVKLS